MLRLKNIFKQTRASNLSSTNSSNLSTTPEQSSSTPLSSGSSINSSSISNTVFDQYLNLNSSNIPKELVPIITLLNCQSSRIYLRGELLFNVEHKDNGLNVNYSLGNFIIKGTKLTIYHPNNNFKPILINLLDSKVYLDSKNNSLVISQEQKSIAYHLKFETLETLQKCLSAIKLSIFELTRLNESYTASLLSCKGIGLSDLHVVLAENRYIYEEQCSVKINGEWKNCLCVVNPYEKKKIGGNNNKKNGSVLFYLGSKPIKKNLICSIDKVDNCFAIFTHVDLIDESSMVKLNGDIRFYEIDQSSTNTSVENTPRSRSRSGSNAPKYVKSHKRGMSSISSFSSLKSNTNNTNNKESQLNNKSQLFTNSSIYIIPKTHHAVKNFETLIRFLIPIYDSFQLYGRPTRLIADKTNPASLLFGLPSLPNSRILTLDSVLGLIKHHWSFILDFEDLSIKNELSTSSDSFDFNSLFNSKIDQLYRSKPDHSGFGNLKDDLIEQSKYRDPFVSYNNSPELTTPASISAHSFNSVEKSRNVENIAFRHLNLNDLNEKKAAADREFIVHENENFVKA